jgi:DNA-binding beta-propeller fold protein YncE
MGAFSEIGPAARSRRALRTVTTFLLGFAAIGVAVAPVSRATTPTPSPYSYVGYFPTGNYNDSIAIDPSTHDVYTAGNTVLTKYDPETTAVASTSVGGEEGVAVDPANHAVYVSAFLGRAYGVVDGTSNELLKYAGIGYAPNQIALDQKTHTLYIADQAGGAGHLAGITVVHEGDDEDTTAIPFDAGAVALALDPVAQRLYVSDFHDYKITVIDTGSNTIIDTIDLGADGFVNGLALDPAAGKLWVSSGATGHVVVINTSNDSIDKSIPVGYSMWGIGINEAQGLVFVADQSSAADGGVHNNTGSVSILDEATESLLTTVDIGGTAHALAVDPDLGRVYVTDAANPRVVILGTAPTYGTGTLSFHSRSYTTNAGSATTVEVDRIGDTTGVSKVDYATSPGTAVAGTDYTTATGTLTFPAGATSETFTVASTAHGALDASPTIHLALSNPVNGGLRDPQTATIALREGTPPLVHNQSPPDTVTFGQPYTYTYTATGSPAPAWSIASGSPPAGLTLNTATGVLSGTPTGSGTSTFSVQADNGIAPTSPSQPVTMTVKTPPVFTVQSPPTTAAESTTAYFAYQFVATGYPAPTYSVGNGSLPSGLALVGSNGYIVGYPRGPGAFTFRIKASNGVSPEALSNSATITVSGDPVSPDPPTISGVTAGNGRATVAFTPPAYTGGHNVTGYTVTASPGGATAHGATSPLVVTGLANGTAYTFTVTATNSVGDSTPSAASNPATPSAAAAASVLSAGKSIAITSGGSATVSAALSSAGHPIAGGAVALLARSSSRAGFVKIAPLTTSAGGIASAKVKPSHNTQYEFSYQATASYAGSTSGVQSVSVAYAVTAALKSGKVKHAKPATLYGTVSPATAGDKVRLQQLVKGKWKTVLKPATVKRQKLPNGRTALGFVFTIAKAAKATYVYRVERPASATNTAGRSGAVKLKRV